jgi:ribosomal protein S18 acetylase RimI-like enzyme
MSKTVFRKIGGRIVPIKIGSKVTRNSMGYDMNRRIVAKIDGKAVGDLEFGKPYRLNKTLRVLNVHVDQAFRGNGIATALYDHLMRLAKRSKKFNQIESTDIIHSAAVKARNKQGAEFFSRTESGTQRKINFEKAMKLIEDPKYYTGKNGKAIRALTKIKK